MDQAPQYSAKLPYPPIRVEGPNAEYGKAMLSNLGAVSYTHLDVYKRQRYR